MCLSFSLLYVTLLRNEFLYEIIYISCVVLRNEKFLKFSAALVRKLEPGSRGNEQFSVYLRQDLDVVD